MGVTLIYPDTDELVDGLPEVLAMGGLRTVFQPIVELAGSRVIGYEALTRGPSGSRLARPDALFAEARRLDLVGELDWACRAAAVESATQAGLGSPFSLFLNVEPDSLETDAPSAGAEHALAAAGGSLRVILEITERALTRRPAELLRQVDRARAHGWGIAIDDVGADPRSLALMPFLRPDVIKLDLSLVRDRPTRELAKIVNAVRAEAERSGALILAEGIETDADVERALALGASLGQGYLLGRPGPLPPNFAAGTEPLSTRHQSPAPRTPFDLLGRRCPVRASRKPLLIEISKQLEAEAAEIGDTAVVIAAFQHAEFFTPLTHERYDKLARRTAFVAALGTDLSSEPAPGVTGISLAADDPIVGEWTIAVVAPHFAACLSARDLGDTGPEASRRFEHTLTFDRALAIAAAESMLTRVEGATSRPLTPTRSLLKTRTFPF